MSDEYVTITAEEYHGLCKALEMLHNKSFRAIDPKDRKQTDAIGYTFISARRRDYRQGGQHVPAWYVVKRTVYAIDLDPAAVMAAVRNDLRDLDFVTPVYVDMSGKLNPIDPFTLLAAANNYVKSQSVGADFVIFGDPKGKESCQLVLALEGRMIVEIDSLERDFSSGFYRVGYWASDIV